MVHLSVAELPTTSPVTPEVESVGVVTVAVPDMTDHDPVPTVGAFPANVAVVTLHRFWSGPAAATVGMSATLITISSVDEAQDPLVIVHRSVAEDPGTSPVTPEVDKVGVVTVAVPEITDHDPVPTAGAFPASVAVVILHKS